MISLGESELKRKRLLQRKVRVCKKEVHYFSAHLILLYYILLCCIFFMSGDYSGDPSAPSLLSAVVFCACAKTSADGAVSGTGGNRITV
jgi:hypothetical protein